MKLLREEKGKSSKKEEYMMPEGLKIAKNSSPTYLYIKFQLKCKQKTLYSSQENDTKTHL